MNKYDMQVSVHFSKIRNLIIDNINKAEKEVRVAVAWLTDEDLIRVLTLKREMGVKVLVAISDSKENFKDTTNLGTLIESGAQLYVSIKTFLHHKFCLIDDTAIINGSYNWSYPARTNEENITLFILDKNAKDDQEFLKRFNVKHAYLCNRCSTYVTDLSMLDTFKVASKDRASILATLDETEIILREKFEFAVRQSFDQATAAGIRISPSLLTRMESDGGGVEFVKRILRDEMNQGEMKSGFKKLEDVFPPRIDLSLEYLASRPEFQTLFDHDELEFCRGLMKKYNL